VGQRGTLERTLGRVGLAAICLLTGLAVVAPREVETSRPETPGQPEPPEDSDPIAGGGHTGAAVH